MIDKRILKQNKPETPDGKRALRLGNIPGITYPAALPITARRADIVRAIMKHRVVVITGETGSGKTTQIPKMCLEAGRGLSGVIGCTQPRRVATVTVAHRIAEELGEEIGRSVGYQIRFEDRSGRNNYIKIMTDGILLNEAQNDPYLRRYDTIIVDEAHERSLNIDFVLGILMKLLRKRRDIKVIITSATIDTEKFSRAFHAPIIEVSGRMYPVEVRYQPLDHELEESGEITYVDCAVTALEKIMKGSSEGDVLIFMPTEQDIRETCQLIEAKFDNRTTVLPLFARLPWREQRRIFQPASRRKIVVATNVAETSITIPGIRYVIDTGRARISQYNPRSRTTSLPVRAISRSSADQRKGRCGRVQNGICVRLFDHADYESRPLFTEPEILRSNLAEVILRMLSLNLGDISTYPFIDPPHPKNIRDGIDILRELGAITMDTKHTEPGDGQQYSLTERGRMMARLPIDPRISRMIIEAEREGCVNEILIIASALSIQDPRERPIESEKEADKVHARFADHSSDFMTLLTIWNQYHGLMQTVRSKGRMKKFCREYYLSIRRMREWIDVYAQLKEILDEQGWKIRQRGEADDKALYDGIHKSIVSGYLSNIAMRKEKNIYAAARGNDVMIFPGSGLFNKGGSWIVAAEMIETSRLFARIAASIKVEWLEELGGSLCRRTYSEPHWRRDRGEVIAYEQVSLFGLVIVTRRLVSYGPINPDEASEIFIRSALIEGDLRRPLPFLLHNLGVIERISNMEDKIRRRNLLAGEDELARFYQERLPGIYDTRTLQKLIRDRGSDEFLRMKEENVLVRIPEEDELALYPDDVILDGHRFTCDYRYEPGHPEDGVTMKVPLHMISTVPAASADWIVPGLMRERITALLKGLPKEYRKKLQPLSQTCDIIMAEMNDDRYPMISALGKFIHQRFGVDIPASLWNADAIDDRLQLRFAVLDDRGQELTASRDISGLQKDIIAEAQSNAFEKARKSWEKTCVTTWDFGYLPDAIALESEGLLEGYAYPGLEAARGCVNIRLYKNKHEAEVLHNKGVAALYIIYFKNEFKYLKKTISLTGDMKKCADSFGGARSVESAILEKLAHDLFSKNIRSRDAFNRHAEDIRSRILPHGQDIMNRCGPAIKSCYDTSTFLQNLRHANRSNKPALDYLAYLREEMNQLMPGDFLMHYDSERLIHVMKYLKAIGIRAERGMAHLDKALGRIREVNIFSDNLQHMINSSSAGTSEEKLKLIEEYRWMIEEYKVSLFAQELKTAFPVSRKRLEKKKQEIERII
ncbi:ATP-dependent RNA helicase HrpA [bacterium]|nr:MAG: ATP-dependent RNA helicase HrpA [bacterium]